MLYKKRACSIFDKYHSWNVINVHIVHTTILNITTQNTSYNNDIKVHYVNIFTGIAYRHHTIDI